MIKTSLEMLSNNYANVKKQQYITQDNKEYEVGKPWRKDYINSIEGRKELQREVEEPYVSVIMLMWGDSPTISEERINEQ